MRGLVCLRWVLAAGLCGSAAGTARAHCGDECWNPLPMFLAPTGLEVAVDGVLTFSPGYRRAERALEFFTLKVLDAMGEEVPGSFEVHEEFSVFVWRPAQPWLAGATYTVVTHVDTAAWATAEYGAQPGACVTYEREATVKVAAEPLPPVAAPPLVVTSEHQVVQREAPADLVCCDGAYPRLQENQGHCPGFDGERLEYEAGFCTHLRAHGRLEVAYAYDEALLAAAARSNFVSRLLPSGELQWVGTEASLSAPACLQLETIDLAREQVFVDERCFGDDVALGPLEVDPAAALAGSCAGPAYVCEGEDRWDAEQCVTWPEGQVYPAPVAPPDEEPEATETGAAAQSGGGGGCSVAGGPGLLALVMLAGLRRRRRIWLSAAE